jgi:hypothetical protein
MSKPVISLPEQREEAARWLQDCVHRLSLMEKGGRAVTAGHERLLSTHHAIIHTLDAFAAQTASSNPSLSTQNKHTI